MSLAANNLGGHTTTLQRGTEEFTQGFTQPELVEDSSTWKREIKLRKTAKISQIFSWITEVESPKLFESQDSGLFKGDSIERTAGCQKDSFFWRDPTWSLQFRADSPGQAGDHVATVHALRIGSASCGTKDDDPRLLAVLFRAGS